MPELVEVEAARCLLETAVGCTVTSVTCADDDKVLVDCNGGELAAALQAAR